MEWLSLALVLALAALLRLGWQGINSFGFDEARVSLLALEMAGLIVRLPAGRVARRIWIP